MPAPKNTPTPKATSDKTICRWGHGRYHSPATAKDCTSPKAPKHELCAEHEKAMREAVKKSKGISPKPAASARQTSQKAQKPDEAKVVQLPRKSAPPAPERKAHPRTPQGIAAMVAVTTEAKS